MDRVDVSDGIRLRLTDQAARHAGLGQLSDFGRTGVLWIVRDVTRKFSQPYECGYCTRRAKTLDGYKALPVFHDGKTYHFELDADLSVMVSPTIWNRLQYLVDCGGFELVNTVASPPAQGLEVPSAKATLRPAEM